MATIRRRGAYQWQVLIRRKGYPAQTKTFEIKADAETWARSIENQMDRGVFISMAEAESTTLGEALDRYAEEVTPLKKGAARELDRIRYLKRHPLTTRYLANIRAKDMAKYRDERMKAGISPSTYQKEHALISHLFTTARKEWGMDGLANPAAGIRKPKVNNQRDRRLLPGEEIRLLEAAKGQGLRTAIILALETGMRRGEMVDIRWDWVDLKRPVIVLPDTKSGDPREVPLTRKAVKVLRELPRRLDGRVLGINTDQLTRGFRIACANAKDSQGEPSPIKDLHFHDLRHEATSRLFEKGLNPMHVAAITGHKTLQMLKRYTHLRAEDLAKMLG